MEVRVPDIGDFTDVPVIEILVGPGGGVEEEPPLVVLEPERATMETPPPAGGKVGTVSGAVGDTVSEGPGVLTLETGGGAASRPGAEREVSQTADAAPAS